VSIEPLARIPVGIVVERRKADSRWIDYLWRPVAALAGEPAAAPWTVLSQDGETVRFFAGTADVELFRTETAYYRDNLVSGAPSLWVVLRPTDGDPPYEIATVTADPYEGEGFTQVGDDLVEAVPMPPAIRDEVDAFVAKHHVEQPFVKRKRDRANPDALARRTAPPKERKP
jgi:hypothetical protein